MEKETKQKSKLELWVQVGGLIVGVVALIATIFFSIKSDRTKELTITYISKRPLLISENSRTAAALEINVAGNRVTAPWLLAGRLENTGNLPIEERDIEAPVQVKFDKAKVLAADITQKNQDALFATMGIESGAIKLQHKLLNPGDWIAFDIVLEGEPTLPPATLFRISGVSELKNFLQFTGQQKIYPILLEAPRPVIYLLLVISTATGVLLTVFGPVIIGSAIRDVYRMPASRNNRGVADYRGLADHMMDIVEPSTKASKVIYTLIDHQLKLEELDDPRFVAQLISRKVPESILSTLDVSLQFAADTLCHELKHDLRSRLASSVFSRLPSGPDAIKQNTILRLDLSTTSATELLQRTKDILDSPTSDIPVRKRVDAEQVFGGLLVLIVGLSLVSISGGTWRTLLGV